VRLAAKLTVALSVIVATGLVLQTVAHHGRMRAVYDQEAKDELAVLTRATQGAVAEIWSLAGREAAAGYVASASSRRAATSMALAFDAAPIPTASHAPQRVAGTMSMSVPIVVDGQQEATLTVTRSLKHEQHLLDRLFREHVVTTLGITLLLGIAAMAIGYIFVARPAKMLLRQLVRIGEGDYEPRPALAQRDEVAELAAAINGLAGRLHETRCAAREQHRARAAMLEQLRHADRLSTVGKLSSGLAHELGTPLNVVAGRASMIASNPEATSDVVRNAEIIVERADYMTDIIRQLLNFARRGLNKTRTPVHDLLDQAVTLVEPLAEVSHVTIAVAEGDRSLGADIDAGKALQVLTNLMVNGVQAMPRGGTLTLGAGSEVVERPPDDRAAPGHYVYLYVDDEGIGIPAEQLDRVFAPFFTTKPPEDGTGLGLSVCHGLVREHGGWMDIKSTPGKGSRFTVYLPAGEPSHANRFE
jgi:two-component system, NtrC family, sensor kinase